MVNFAIVDELADEMMYYRYITLPFTLDFHELGRLQVSWYIAITFALAW